MTLEIQELSVAERTIQSIVSAGYTSILVVTGHDADKLRIGRFDATVHTSSDTRTEWEHSLPKPSTYRILGCCSDCTWRYAFCLCGNPSVLREISIQAPKSNHRTVIQRSA